MEVPRLERKLVAILAADIEGYSRHMERDEVATLATLSAHRLIVDGLIARYEGRITGTAGDSVLAEFGSVVHAVDCAVEVQKVIAAASQDTSLERRMLFRIGVNVGDVMVKDGDIFGDGVNVAARLEALAEPGGVCVSRGVRDHLRKQSPYVFEDLGEQSVKNIAQAVRAFRVRFDADVDAKPIEAQEPISARGGAVPSSASEPAFELTFWDSIKESRDRAEFEAYLEGYPDGAFVALAQARLQALAEQDIGPDESVDTMDVAVELAFWESAKDSSDPSELEAYLERYPEGSFAPLAQARLDVLLAAEARGSNVGGEREPAGVELTFWESIKESRVAAEIKTYLVQYPKGRFSELAQARLKALAEEGDTAGEPRSDSNQTVELAFWDTVKESSNPAMYEAYLAAYPDGLFATLAKVRLSELSR